MNRKVVCVLLLLVSIVSLATYEMVQNQNQSTTTTTVSMVTPQQASATCHPLFYWTISGTYTTTISPYSYSSPLLFDVTITRNGKQYVVTGVSSVDDALWSLGIIRYNNTQSLENVKVYNEITENSSIQYSIAYHAYRFGGVQLTTSRPLPIGLFLAGNSEGAVTGSGFIVSNYQGYGGILRLGNQNPVSVDVTYSTTSQGYAHNMQNYSCPVS